MSDVRALVVDQRIEGGRIREHSVEVKRVPERMLLADDGTVTVDVRYSSLNYKDGLVIAGRPGVARISPLVPGIDVVGVVRDSRHPRWHPGDQVILNGTGLGERRHGGLAELASVPGELLVDVPPALGLRRAAAIGTAGFTAMLAVLALERGGITPRTASEPSSSTSPTVLVTGAAGGVGSIAIALLSRLGYRTIASTGRAATEADYLRNLGADEVIDRSELEQDGKPLRPERWDAVIDVAGSRTLANAIAATSHGGVVAACGLAAGPDLPITVLPFILRGVHLAGIDSVQASADDRRAAWSRLARDLDLDLLEATTTVASLDDTIGLSDEILAGRIRGRVVIDTHA